MSMINDDKNFIHFNNKITTKLYFYTEKNSLKNVAISRINYLLLNIVITIFLLTVFKIINYFKYY